MLAQMDNRPLVDPMCFDLAQHFLPDAEGYSDDQRWDLAKTIQEAVEDWCLE